MKTQNKYKQILYRHRDKDTIHFHSGTGRHECSRIMKSSKKYSYFLATLNNRHDLRKFLMFEYITDRFGNVDAVIALSYIDGDWKLCDNVKSNFSKFCDNFDKEVLGHVGSLAVDVSDENSYNRYIMTKNGLIELLKENNLLIQYISVVLSNGSTT